METKLKKLIQELKELNRIASDELSKNDFWMSDSTRVGHIHHINCRLTIIKQLEAIL